MATVFIWNNNMITLGHGYPGHASMLIDDRWEAEDSESYVSFWASETATLTSGRHAASANLSLEADLRAEANYVPDHVIRIAGLDTGRMAAEWRTTRQEYASYDMVRQNCSAAVARVLKAGSSGGGFLRRHNAIWTPLKVKRLALSMGGSKMSWSALLGEVVAAGALTPGSRIYMENQPKRDARHGRGSATANFAHAGNYKFESPPSVLWNNPLRAPPVVAASTGGTLLGGATMWDLMDDIDEELGAPD